MFSDFEFFSVDSETNICSRFHTTVQSILPGLKIRADDLCAYRFSMKIHFLGYPLRVHCS